ncbi:MAG: N-acetylglutaminylglutamine amidotransferase [SAR324 cluster bacterium]|nr:N-acetylglutaminylglutamine amidotransferase [SAR324 cluster bacterium]
MCGIAGILNTNHEGNLSRNMERMESMLELMKFRGPDAYGTHFGENYVLGHRRLMIIDLSEAGSQPMIDKELGLALVFNGAIYNYCELRAELQSKGYQFFSMSDTEVIIKAYHCWGEDFLPRLNGMFAICLVELDSGKALLARDRLGIKPLYYAMKGQELAFASSLPALVKGFELNPTIDRLALQAYLTFHAVIPPPATIFNEVKKLSPGTLMNVDEVGNIQFKKIWWNLDFQTSSEKKHYQEEDWIEELDIKLGEAVKRRLVADVPVGVLLSGGLDSSLIAAYVSKHLNGDLKTFSIGFDAAGGESGDEFVYSDLIADVFQTDHHQLRVSGKNTLAAVNSAIDAMSEPMVSHDNVGFYLISQEVAKHVKVVQSGQGADEVFAGYHWYPPMQDCEDAVATYTDCFFDRSYNEYLETVQEDWHWIDYASDYVKHHFSAPGAENNVDRALRLDISVMLVDDPVKRVDNQTMAWGLEARVPFLDHELVELAAQIPPEFKLANNGKGILKKLARRYLPDEVIDRPKGYFPVPALKYIEGPFLEFVRDSLTNQIARNRGLYRKDYVDSLLASPETGITKLGGSKLWQLGLLEIWLQRHQF